MLRNAETRKSPRRLIFALGLCCTAATSLAIAPPKPSTAPATRPTTQPGTQPATKPATEKLTLGGEEFDLELAVTAEARELGLMHRDHIDDHGGMLFIYPWPQVLSYWMKNCPIEMDIVFISDKGVVVATHRMLSAPPHRAGESEAAYDNRLPRYDSRRPAQFAIELQAGTVERLKIKPGDKIEMELKRLAKMAEP
ncbi:MAG TPA: DUF192 domain-containing protein [Phycisphaerales bacterium]|nr:DUF192 domain-containing protein [Phycisphaerales bacterium]